MLTADHCAGARPGDRVVIGGNEVRYIQEVIVPAQSWSVRPRAHDIKLLRLKAPSTKRPIRLATQLPPPNTTVLLLGKGTKLGKNGQADTNEAFQKIALTYVTNARANQLWQTEPGIQKDPLPGQVKGSIPALPALFITISTNRRSGCTKDSGGPLVRFTPSGPELLGVFYGATTDCNRFAKKTAFSMFMSVPHFRSWILDHMRDPNFPQRAMRDLGCWYVPRVRSGDGRWKCPAQAAWDSGVMGGPNDKACTKRRSCATVLNQSWQRGGGRASADPFYTQSYVPDAQGLPPGYLQ